MSRAEDRAKERYWLEPNNIETQEKYAVYVEGYRQAEKDLELTWEDIQLIVNIDMDTNNEEALTRVRENKEHYEEVLRRFLETKK